METKDKQLEIIKALGDNRSKLSALFSLYNTSLIMAEQDRADLTSYYEQMIDFKNDINSINLVISSAKKSEREEAYTKNKSKIKKIDTQMNSVNNDFNNSCKKYKLALQECGSLKTEYKHAVSELCKEFKATMDENTPAIVIKGYKQQVKLIRAILDRIELLISDYNVKRNKVDEDTTRFSELYTSVNDLINKLQTIA